MTACYEEHFGSPERLPPVPNLPEELTRMTMQMANFTVHDERTIKTRKLLTVNGINFTTMEYKA